ncbi:MAG: hypothetical protein WCD04_16150, partial [Terriglobia bacterium]
LEAPTSEAWAHVSRRIQVESCADPGSVSYVASNAEQGIINAGPTLGHHFVIALGPGKWDAPSLHGSGKSHAGRIKKPWANAPVPP